MNPPPAAPAEAAACPPHGLQSLGRFAGEPWWPPDAAAQTSPGAWRPAREFLP